MATASENQTATLLLSGKVLVTGGLGSSGDSLARAEVYDPATEQWSSTGSLAWGRYGHTATLLPSGKVLVTGGSTRDGAFVISSQVYDPATGTWSPTGRLVMGHSAHTATLLPSGKVLVAGGVTGSLGYYLASAEIYDPATGMWSPTGALATARTQHTATLLPSGQVLVTGGRGLNSTDASTEVYDPATGGWSIAGALATARSEHTATLLPSGKVLVTGGQGLNDTLDSAEVYDPATRAWSPTGTLATVHRAHRATLLPSGLVLITGGKGLHGALASAEVYDPAMGVWTPTGGLASAREHHTATLLPSGLVLVTGGNGSSVTAINTAEVYEGAGARPEWRPIMPPVAERQPGEAFQITGGRLRGVSEASSGNTQSSATNLPLVSLLALEGEKLTRVTVLDSPSDTEVTVQMPLVTNGYYLLCVMSNAIPGGLVVRMNEPPLVAPELTSPAAFVNTPKPAIAGTAMPGSTVVVRLDGTVAGTTQADPQGQWSFTPGTALAEGLHRAVATTMGVLGDAGPDSEERSFTVDTVPPATPGVTAPGALANTQTPDITGTAEPGSTVSVSLDDDEAKGGTVEADAAGAWRFSVATALSEGLHQAKVTARDKAGNASPTSVVHAFTVDTVPPDAPVVTAPGIWVDTLTPVIRGTAEPHSTLRVWPDEDETKAETIAVDAAGDWRLISSTALVFGKHSVSATAMDAAANLSAPTQHQFYIQRSHYGWGCTTAPAVPAAWVLLVLAWSLGRRYRSR